MRLYLADVKIFHGSHLRFNLVKMPSLPLMLSFFFQPWRLCAQWESIRSSHSVECADMSHRMTDSNKPRKRYIYASTYLSFFLSFFFSIYLSIDRWITRSICLFVYLSIYLANFPLGLVPQKAPTSPKIFHKIQGKYCFLETCRSLFW